MAFGMGSGGHVVTTFTARDEMTKSINTMRKSVESLGGPKFGLLGNIVGGLASMSGGMVAGGLAIGAFTGLMGDSIGAAEAQQVQLDKLKQALLDNIPAWNGNMDAIDATIKSGEQLGFQRKDQEDALAQLVLHTHDAAKAQDLLTTAEDLARQKGMDLLDASLLLGKVYDGNFTSAKKLGIQIDKNATSTQALGQISQAVAGQAATFASTAEGAQQRMSAAIETAKENIGQGLLPVVAGLADAVVNVIDGIGNIGDAFNNLVRFVNPALAATQDEQKALHAVAAEAGNIDMSKFDALVQKMADAGLLTGKVADDLKSANVALAAGGLDAKVVIDAYQKMAAASNAAQRPSDLMNEETQAVKAMADQFGTTTGRIYDDMGNLHGTLSANLATEYSTLKAAGEAAVADASRTASRVAGEAFRAGMARTDADATQWGQTIPGDFATTVSATLARNKALLNLSVKDFFNPVADQAKLAADAAVRFMAQMPPTMADAIKSTQSDIKKAMANLVYDIDHPMSKAKEIARLQAKLAGKHIHDGLTSKFPDTRQETFDMVQYIKGKIAELRGLSTTITVGVGSYYGSSGRHTRDGGRAEGGPVWGGGTFLVGERGPELLHMGSGQNGTVVPNGGGGTPPTQHIHLNLDGREIAMAVTEWQGNQYVITAQNASNN